MGAVKKMGVFMIGVIICVCAAVTVLLIISGIYRSPQYLDPWRKDYAKKFSDPRVQLSAHGLLAANGHNMQPWRIRLDRDDAMVFYLYADNSRLTSEVDPYARQMMITQGAFLGYVAVAGDEFGYNTDIELFPQGSYDEHKLSESMDAFPVAKVTLIKTVPRHAPLYDYIFMPDTNRAAYLTTKLTSEQVAGLKNTDSDDGVSIAIFQDKENMDRLGSYAVKGASVEAGVNRIMKETEAIFRANEYQKNRYRYGFSVEGQGTSGIMKHIMQGLVTLFPSLNQGKASSDLMVKSVKRAVANTPAYAMIISKDNTRLNQVKSGMIYSRLLLEAHRQGFAMQPLSQVLEEYPEMRKLYAGIHKDYALNGSTIQMFVRLGRPAEKVPLSMRRDVIDIVVAD